MDDGAQQQPNYCPAHESKHAWTVQENKDGKTRVPDLLCAYPKPPKTYLAASVPPPHVMVPP